VLGGIAFEKGDPHPGVVSVRVAGKGLILKRVERRVEELPKMGIGERRE
jgi:hypothetical protein